MCSRFRVLRAVVGSGLIIFLLLYTYNMSVLAAETNFENVLDNQVYLPYVIQSEKVIPIPIIPPDASYEDQVIILTNQERMNHGCGPLIRDDRLQLAAEGHSQDMAIKDYFSHFAPDGTTPWDRIRAQGYFYSMAGENIAAGFPSPESVVEGWMNSDGHRANILNCGFKDIGVGYHYFANDTGAVNYRHYWTQVFASP